MKPITFTHNLKTAFLIINMNLRVIFLRKSMWASVFLFALTLLFLFPFAFGAELIKRFDVQIGSYWMIQEFVVALVILNMFKIEQEGHLLEIYSGTRNSKLSLFFGKVLFTTLHILTLQLPLSFLWAILFNIQFSFLLIIWPTLLLSSFIFAFTSSLLGGFLYAVTSKNQIKEILQPLLFFPLQSASLLASVGVCVASQNIQTVISWSVWWGILLIYSTLFVGISLIFGDMLFEE